TGLYADHSAAAHLKAHRRRVLQEPSPTVAECPGIGLKRAMGIRVSAEMMKIAAEDVVSRERYEVAHLPGIQHIGVEPLPRTVVEGLPVEQELMLIERNADPLGPEFRRVAEQLVHQRPQALLLPEERTMVMRATAPVASRGSPARGARLDDQSVDAIACKPPSGAESGNTAADDDDCGTRAAARAHSLATGS